MISLVRGGGGLPWKAIALAWGISAFSGSTATAHEGAGGGGICDWGEYGLGPHLPHRGCGHGCGANDFGYPYFTHPMGPGSPYCGAPAGGYGAFGPYTGAPPYPSPSAVSGSRPAEDNTRPRWAR